MKRWAKLSQMLFPLVFGLSTYVAAGARAQTFTNLHNFNGTDGASPQGGLILSNNTLYGATAGGGVYSNGTVFAMNTDGTGFTNLHNFTNSDGVSPFGRLVLSGNTLYGTANGGGQWGNGTVFAVNTDGSGFRVLHNFTVVSNYANSDGAGPSGGQVLSGNTLYGATQGGGEFGQGTIFAINTNATSVSGITILHNFAASAPFFVFPTNSDGARPNGGLALAGNTLYGTANDSGLLGAGSVFAVNTDGTGFKPLWFFNRQDPGSVATGMFPSSGMALSGNRLYGTTPYGGNKCEANLGFGKVFALNTDGSSFETLHDFLLNGGCPIINYANSEGAWPFAGMIVEGGTTLYGTASQGGWAGNGTVFGLNTDGTGFTVLHTFTNSVNSDGAAPADAGLVIGGNTLYGTTTIGGSSGGGTVFSITLPQLKLSIAVSGPNVILSWPTNFPGSTLQFTAELAPLVWNVNLSPSAVVNGEYTVTNPISAKPKFYRLHQGPNRFP